MKIAVLGAGHVGLVTAVTLAKLGREITVFDADPSKNELLRQSKPPFHEPGLDELVVEQTALGNLVVAQSAADAVARSDVVFVCVGTPARADGAANLAAVEATTRSIARGAQTGTVVAEKSTVPAGTAERIAQTLARERPGTEFHVVSNPEFLREGSAVADSLSPERILIGGSTLRGFEAMRSVYAPLIQQGVRYIETDLRTAELAKHACNAFLALKISYANALARLCERAGADVVKVAEVMGADPRIGPAFLSAGIGYGGYCFPKDLAAFEHLAEQLGVPFPLLGEIVRINQEALDAAAAKVEDAVWNIDGKRIAFLGLSYKPGTDDTRFSPALELARRLIDRGAHVVGFDPAAAENAARELPALELARDPYEAAAGAHCLVLATEWPEFGELDLPRLRTQMAYPIVVDGRNLFDPSAMASLGFTYHPTGRPAHSPDAAPAPYA